MINLEMVAETNISRRLAHLYSTHARSAGRLAYLLLGDADLAEDIVQDAFVRVAGRLGRIRSEAFGSYLRRTIVNLSKGHIRRSIIERRSMSRGIDSPQSVEAVDLSERDVVLRALDRLPYRQKAAVVLRYYEDLSEQQVADILDCALGTVKSLVFRAMSTLREELGDDD